MGNYIDNIAAAITIVLFIFLGYKIYQNKKMMRPAEEKSSKDKAEEIMHGFVDQPMLWVKLAKGEAAASPDEDVRMSLMVNAAFQEFEAQCARHESAALEAKELEALSESVSRICGMPGVHKYLNDIKPQLSQRLQSIIDDKK